MSFYHINLEVMNDTVHQCRTNTELKEAIRASIGKQKVIMHEDVVKKVPTGTVETCIVISGNRTFEAAKGYTGHHVAVLNFANNHSVGGAPFFAGAQEESLCRCSTLYPCLKEEEETFYRRHQNMFSRQEIGYMGNDDIIYTPDVVVFKTDERTMPIHPQMMEEKDWYKADVITCAAPEANRLDRLPDDYRAQIETRIRKIFDVAASNGVEVLILGAWGCGAFANPKDVIASTFLRLLKDYSFQVVEFALSCHNVSGNPFAIELEKSQRGVL